MNECLLNKYSKLFNLHALMIDGINIKGKRGREGDDVKNSLF